MITDLASVHGSDGTEAKESKKTDKIIKDPSVGSKEILM